MIQDRKNITGQMGCIVGAVDIERRMDTSELKGTYIRGGRRMVELVLAQAGWVVRLKVRDRCLVAVFRRWPVQASVQVAV